MAIQNINAKELSEQWASRMRDRMTQLGIPDDEVTELHRIIRNFTKTSTEILIEDKVLKLPYTEETPELTDDMVHTIIEIFLRGVNQASKFYRGMGLSWEDRKPRIENMGWKIFNLAKLLVGHQLIPNPILTHQFKERGDLKIMMKHSVRELLKTENPSEFI